MLWAKTGLSETDAVALSAHTCSVGLLGAALRLGLITHIGAQRLLATARREATRLAAEPIVPLGAISTYSIETEIAAMRHAFRDLRLFAN